MKLLPLVTATLTFTLAAVASAAEQSLQQIADEQFAFAAKHYEGLLKRMEAEPPLHQPRSVVGGKLKAVRPEDWTSGFFPGALWLVYEHTGKPEVKAAADAYTRRLDRLKTYGGTHDLGFMIGCSYGQAYRLTGDESYLQVIREGAKTLATRFNPKAGVIRSWDFGPWTFPVIVDNMMNLEFLVLASRRGGEERLNEIALTHANTTLRNHFREDGSSVHLVDYNPETGGVLKKQTVQGFADPSSWARGQAWGLYGYTRMAGLTGDPSYLAQARRIADFIVNHPRLPADGIPYWDYDVPHQPDALRDASAGAITACALLELADLVDGADAARYRALGEKQLRSLSTGFYRADLNENGNFLIMHCVGHLPEKSEVDVPLAYADYYYLEGLARYATKRVKAANRDFAPTSR